MNKNNELTAGELADLRAILINQIDTIHANMDSGLVSRDKGQWFLDSLKTSFIKLTNQAKELAQKEA